MSNSQTRGPCRSHGPGVHAKVTDPGSVFGERARGPFAVLLFARSERDSVSALENHDHDFLPGSDYKTYDEIKSFLLNNNFKVTRSKRNKFPWDKFFIFAEK